VARATGDRIDVERLVVHHAGGEVKAHGGARLDGFRPGAFDGSVTLARLPLARGSFTTVVDAELGVHLEPRGSGVTGDVSVRRGAARLSHAPVDRALQSTAPPDDVVFVGAAAPAAATRSAITPVRVEALGAHLRDPLRVRGRDLGADLTGDLRVDVRDGMPKLAGVVEALPGGWIDLFGRRYALKRLRFVFDDAHPIDPLFDIRATRELPDAVVGFELTGSSRDPVLHLTAEPPRYDQTQLTAIILSGD